MNRTFKNGSNSHAQHIAALLPRNFLIGAATSAYQVEGAATADGRGPSIWDPFLADPSKPHSGNTGDLACDHYNRYQEDVALMKKLNLHAYRFSIAWPRVFPSGRGKLNAKGLAFYDRLVDELLNKGIEPYATLYHWDLPLALQDELGGWLSRETCQAFADYCQSVVSKLGDRVKHWTTFNEPEVIVAGYIGNGMAPAYNRPDLPFHVGHNLLLAHGLGAQAIRAANSSAKVGIVLNYNNIDPADQTLQATAAAHTRFTAAYNWYLKALLEGKYPDFVQNKLEGKIELKLPANQPVDNWLQSTDLKTISQPLDYLGINYYTRFVVDGEGKDVQLPNRPRTQMGWDIDPFGLARLLERLNREFKLPPLYITENGAAIDDNLVNGKINDNKRVEFIAQHLSAIATAIDLAQVDLRGYFVWSLLDNLEWPLGFAKTFGIVHVDRRAGQKLKRTIKQSGKFFGSIAKALRTKSK